MRKQTLKENWNSFWRLDASRRFGRRSWSKIRIMQLLDGYVRPGMKVLDAGCGSGFFSEYFISRGCRVHTLDYSETALEMARLLTHNGSEAYLHENLLDESFGDRHEGEFDLIFSDGLFEHFTRGDQEKIMCNFRRSKAADGLIATFVPNKFSWWEIVRPLVMPGIHEEPFTLARLIELHEGMELVAHGGINVLPFSMSPDAQLGSRFGMLLYCFAR